MSIRDARRIVENPKACTLDPDVTFIAIADAPCPLGPMPGLSGKTAVDTPDGPVQLCDVAVEDLVCVEENAPLRVLWSGSVTLPALERLTAPT
jgi:hypothetical protein